MIGSRDWKSRSSALAILVLALGAVLEGLVLPLAASIQDSETAIERSNEAIGRYEAIIADLPRLRDDLQREKTELSSSRLLGGSAAPELDAELQTRVQKIVTVAGAVMQDSRILAPAVENSLSKFAIQLEVRGTPEQIAAIVKSAEEKEAPLFIDKLAISVPENGEGQRDGRGQPVANATIQFSGYSSIQLESAPKK